MFQGYAKSVTISSKLVARITRLPYLADPMKIEHQVTFYFHFHFLFDHLPSLFLWVSSPFNPVGSYSVKVTTALLPEGLLAPAAPGESFKFIEFQSI